MVRLEPDGGAALGEPVDQAVGAGRIGDLEDVAGVERHAHPRARVVDLGLRDRAVLDRAQQLGVLHRPVLRVALLRRDAGLRRIDRRARDRRCGERREDGEEGERGADGLRHSPFIVRSGGKSTPSWGSLPRRRAAGERRAAAKHGGPMSAPRDPELEGFLALLAARRAAAHRRGVPPRPRRARRLARRARPRPPRPRSSSAGSPSLRADGPRRDDDRAARRRVPLALPPPAAPRRPRRQPRRRARAAAPDAPRSRGRSRVGEAERLIDAASGTAPRALRDRALVELLYGAGLRVGEAVGLERARRRPRAPARPRASARAARSAIVPIGREAVEALRRYLARGRPAPRPPPPARALPQRAGRRAHPRRRVPDPAPARRRARASSPSTSTRTCCATRSRRTCSRAAPTSAASRRCSATPTSRRPSSTRTSPIGAGASCTSEHTRTRGAVAVFREGSSRAGHVR